MVLRLCYCPLCHATTTTNSRYPLCHGVAAVLLSALPCNNNNEFEVPALPWCCGCVIVRSAMQQQQRIRGTRSAMVLRLCYCPLCHATTATNSRYPLCHGVAAVLLSALPCNNSNEFEVPA